MPAVVIEDVHKSFGPVEVLKGVSLTVEAGQVVAIIGRSGSGKSTLLRCVNGLEACQSGRIEVAGHKLDRDPEKLRELRKDVGIVFQSYNLFPHLTVGQNIMLAPRIVKGVDKAEAESGRAMCWARSAFSRSSTPIPTICRAASSSAWRSPGRWRCSRR